jgi:hypothetical protein
MLLTMVESLGWVGGWRGEGCVDGWAVSEVCVDWWAEGEGKGGVWV